MQSPPKPCSECGTLVRDGTSRCEQHKVRLGTFADARRGTRQERGYGAAWERTRKRILARDKGLCQPCLQAGRVAIAYAVDHIVSRAEGGGEHDTNLQAICRPCHQAKTQAEAARARGRGGLQLPSPTAQDRPPRSIFARASFGEFS